MPGAYRFPSSFKALVLGEKREKQGKFPYHNVYIVERPIPVLKHGEILVKVNAAGFNHREVCLGVTRKTRGCCGDLSSFYSCSSGFDEANILELYLVAR